jgi:glycosyltransferase involved in cell wall biosynthesis/uncharacterized coiled-coil protein SlyX
MKISSAVCYSLNLPYRDPMAYLRLIGPLERAGIRLIDGTEEGRAVVERTSLGEVVVIQRHFPREFADYLGIVQAARRQKKPVVFDMDDLLFFLPDCHPDRKARYYATSLLPMYQALMDADLVTVSTPQLCDVLSRYNRNVVVLPNYFEDSLWRLAVPKERAEAPEVVSVGYMGGQSHEPDLDYVVPALLELAKARPDRVSFRFWGVEPPAALRQSAEVAWTPFRVSSYEEFAAFFQTQSADIFIAPLTDTLFNRCKSPLKFFEYSALGVPGVYSCLAPYQQVVSHGKNGLLAGSPHEWSDCLVQLVDDVELRRLLAANAQAAIEADWLASRNAYRWQEAYGQLDGESLGDEDSAAADITGSVSVQLAEAFADTEAKARTLASQARTLASQVQDRDAVVEMLGRQLGERDRRIDALVAEVGEREGQLGALRGRVAEQGAAVESLRAELVERQRQLAERDAQIESLGRSLADRDSKVTELDARLREIVSSKVWRAGAAAQRAAGFLLGPGRRRLSAVERAFSFVRGRMVARTRGKRGD